TTVGGHHLGGDEVVDREAVPSDQVTDTAAERNPPNPDRAGIAQARGEPVGAGGRRVFARRQPGLGPGGVILRIDLEGPHPREVENDPAVRGTVAGATVAAAADGELEAAVARQGD